MDSNAEFGGIVIYTTQCLESASWLLYLANYHLGGEACADKNYLFRSVSAFKRRVSQYTRQQACSGKEACRKHPLEEVNGARKGNNSEQAHEKPESERSQSDGLEDINRFAD